MTLQDHAIPHRPPTLRDVAAHAGVSQKTVSRVVNDEHGVKADTRDKVQASIALLGYRPDTMARSLRGGHAYALGLVYDNPNAHYVIGMQDGALSACEDHGYGLQILPCQSTSSQLAHKLITIFERAHLGGLILTPPMSEQPQLIQELHRRNIPLVKVVSAAAPPQDGQNCVYVNDRRAAHAITAHLIQLGHSKIAFLGGDRIHGSNIERQAGYLEALDDYGVRLDPQLVVNSNFRFDDGFRVARKLLTHAHRPTAIFGSNDEIAAGVLAAARSLGLAVPWDLSIAGFEDSPFSRQAWPALTTAKQSPYDIARQATRQLIGQIQDNPRLASGPAGFTPQLLIRGSTASPRSPEAAA
ncbi:LacI family DNA-binding transcriptional regulator [Frateuria aurantia]